jgi:carotenoid cleavage dioxygenase
MTIVENRYLTGNFAPVHEEVTAVDLPVTGTIPESLRGRFLRNGPNPVGAVDPATYHWFGGDGMVHGVRLGDGKADWYRNRWVRAGGVIEALGVPDPGGEIHSGMDFAANTNVIGHAGKTLAIVEAGGRPIELSYELDTLRRGDFDGTLPNGFTAHPKRDPETGELHAVCYWWGLGNQVQYIVVDTAGKVTKVVPIETTGAPMLHDMGLSERYALVLDLPCVFDLELASAGRFPYKWDESYPARVGVLPRDGGNDDVKWFEIDPCYIFHPMNTFDDGDRVVFDAVRHPKMFATELNGPNEGQPTLGRWTFDLSNGKVVEERLDDRGQEFPRHDERLIGKPYRYGYVLASDPGLVARGIFKHDLHAGTKVEHDFGAGTHAAEPVFVPASDDAAEDDGYVMTFVYDEKTDRSDLVILHAQDFGGDPVASVHLPQRVPYGFHGNWVPDPA